MNNYNYGYNQPYYLLPYGSNHTVYRSWYDVLVAASRLPATCWQAVADRKGMYVSIQGFPNPDYTKPPGERAFISFLINVESLRQYLKDFGR